MPAIPTLDLRRFAPDAQDRTVHLDELRRTVSTLGAFYLIGHGIAPDEADHMFALVRRFFALSESDRRSIEMANSPHFRGYTALGNELTQGRPDWREEVDIGAERPQRHAPGGPPYWGLQGPNQWPAALPELRPAALAWIERMRDIAAKLSRALVESLGLPRDYFDDAFTPDPHLLLKLVHYPGQAADAGQGVGIHRDSGFLTLILQDERSGSGLQFFDGTDYVDVIPQRGAFVVNLGEALELATAHRLRATLHRVQSPPADRSYFSIPFFYNPRFDYVVKPLEFPAGVLTARTDADDNDPRNPIFAEYGYNALKGRLRSHPEVAQRFYAGVTLTAAAGRE